MAVMRPGMSYLRWGSQPASAALARHALAWQAVREDLERAGALIAASCEQLQPAQTDAGAFAW
jgi:hypothetical protein